jgi:MFS family permease
MPIIVFMYLFSSLDKSNLGNARTLGMMSDIGDDPTGSVYALLNSFYFIAYAPFSTSATLICLGHGTNDAVVPFALLGKRRGVRLVIGIAALVWGSAATCFAAVQNYPGAFACRFFIGFGGTC